MASEVKIASSGVIVTTSPATGEVLAELASASIDEVQAAVRRARDAQRCWKHTSVNHRVAVLRRFQQLLREQRDSVARLDLP
jgi:acyl-CoA reductase-like NAD-dependent aldehyde dehydrogenase